MTLTEEKIADFFIENPVEVIRHNVTTLAEKTNSSNAAIIRLCKKLGYDGFSEFKFSMSKYIISHPKNTVGDKNDPVSSIINSYTQCISKIPYSYDKKDLENLAKIINNSMHIVIWGINRTNISATQLEKKLSKIGILSQSQHDLYEMYNVSEILKTGDLCILFSVSGKGSTSYPELFEKLKSSGCTTVLITMSNSMQKINKNADFTFTLPTLYECANANLSNFYDEQAVFLIFIEILLCEISINNE